MLLKFVCISVESYFQHFKWNISAQITFITGGALWAPNKFFMIGGMYFPIYISQVLMSSPLNPIPGSWQKALPWSISTAALVASSLTRRVPTAPTSALHLSQFQVLSLKCNLYTYVLVHWTKFPGKHFTININLHFNCFKEISNFHGDEWRNLTNRMYDEHSGSKPPHTILAFESVKSLWATVGQ